MIRGIDNLVRHNSEPFEVVQIPGVGFKHGALYIRVGIIKAQDKLAFIDLYVLGIDYHAP